MKYCLIVADTNQQPVHHSDVWQSGHRSVRDMIYQDSSEKYRLSFYGRGNGKDRKSMQACSRFFCLFPNGWQKHLPAL